MARLDQDLEPSRWDLGTETTVALRRRVVTGYRKQIRRETVHEIVPHVLFCLSLVLLAYELWVDAGNGWPAWKLFKSWIENIP